MNRAAIRSSAAVAVAAATLIVSERPAAADLPGQGIIENIVGGATGWAFDKVADGIAGWVLGAVSFFVEGVLRLLHGSAAADVEAVWFSGAGSPYATVRSIAAVLLVGCALLGLIQGLLNGDPGGMVRRIGIGVPTAVAGMAITTVIVGRLLELTDALSAAVLDPAGGDASAFLSGFGVAATTATGGFAAVLIGLVAVIAGLLLWIELLVRAALVYLLVALSPLAFAAVVWPAARGMLRRTVELLLAVIISKFAIAVAIAVGVAALAGAGQAGGGESGLEAAAASIGTLLIGTVVLALAAFAPFLILKLLPAAEAAIVAHGVSRSPGRAVQTAMAGVGAATTVSRLASGAAGTAASALPPPSASAAAAPTGRPSTGGGNSAGPRTPTNSAAPTRIAGAATQAATASHSASTASGPRSAPASSSRRGATVAARAGSHQPPAPTTSTPTAAAAGHHPPPPTPRRSRDLATGGDTPS